MGKSLDWVREEASGRLIYRRAYPEALRPFLPYPRPMRELKVPLRARGTMTPEAFRRYEDAKRRFDRDVREADAARNCHFKAEAGSFDAITPELIKYLAGLWKEEGLDADQDVRWEPRPLERKQEARRRLKVEVEHDLAEARTLRGLGDVEGIVERWGGPAEEHAAAQGVRLRRQDVAFPDYVRAIHDATIESWEAILKRQEGIDVPTPAAPPRPQSPANPRGRARTVAALIDAYTAAEGGAWSQSSRSAKAPVFRVLRDVLGDRDVASIDRDDARHVFETIKGLPAALGRHPELRGMTVPEAVEEAKRRGLPTLNPNTVNRGYMVHVSTVIGWACKEGWIGQSPFRGLSAVDPVAPQDKRDPFTAAQLTILFSSGPWIAPFQNDADRPGAFWVPLVALFMGARLGEIAGLRVMDVEELDGRPALRIRPHAGRGVKNDGSRRDLPIHSALRGLGFLAFVEHRRRKAGPEELLFPDGKANSRGQSGAKLGGRFGDHIKALGMTGTKLGIHSFRHGWEDRLRRTGHSGTDAALRLAGRKVKGSQETYGNGFIPADMVTILEAVTYPGLDLQHLVQEGITREV